MFKLSPEQARQKWIEALRSGEYEQGIGWLCNGGKYCCLGVACEVFQQIEGGLEIADEHCRRFQRIEGGLEIVDDHCRTYDGEEGVLPKKVQDWLDINTARGGYGDSTLAEDNDYGLKSLFDIANIIESRPQGLFNDDSHPPVCESL